MDAGIIAYFSMEVALEAAIPTYAGGLGVLAGDTLRSAADAGLPLVGVTLVSRKGYLRQRIDASGWQHTEPDTWSVEEHLVEMPVRVVVRIEERAVAVRAWKYEVVGRAGARVPVLLLDTDVLENAAWDRAITHYLYGGDSYYRLCQEIVLGIGGVRMLRALGYVTVHRYHLNEGHSSLLTLELLLERARAAGRSTVTDDDVAEVRNRCIFTTHTPVSAAHDQYPMDLVGRVLRQGHEFFGAGAGAAIATRVLHLPPGSEPGELFRPDLQLNLTLLALNLSHYINGVAKRHAALSQRLFAKYHVDDITNGVHAATWVSTPVRAVLDRHIPGWSEDNFSLRYALNLPGDELWEAHRRAKQALLDRVREQSGCVLDASRLTLGFARRFTPYKRADLLLRDPDRLRRIAAAAGGLQLVYAGKAHPNDHAGKEIIQQVLRIRESLAPEVTVVFLENYDLEIARVLTAGVDVWVNTPLPPFEASGTSGMKAALNGVPSLSTLDGWWLEGCIEGVTGWAVGDPPGGGRDPDDAGALYRKLEEVVVPRYRDHRDEFVTMMRHAIAINGSFFNTQRMVEQYALKAYL